MSRPAPWPDRETGPLEDSPALSAPSDTLYTRDFWLVFAASFAFNSAANLFVLFPLFVMGLGGSAGAIGAIVGTGSLAALLARPLVGNGLDAFGRKWMTIRFLMFDAVATVLYLAVGSLGWPMYFVRVLHGAIDGTARVALFAFVYDILPAGRQGEAMATFSLCGMIPAALAPMAGEELIRRGGFGAFFAVACGLCVVAAYAARRFPDDRPARGPGAAIVSEGPGYPALLADRALLPFWIATLLFALAISSRTSFVAPFAYERGIERVGWYFAIYSSVGAALRVVSGRSIDRIGLERMLAPSFAVLALGLAAIAFTGYSGMLNLAALIGGIGHGYVYPVLSALVIARTQPNAIGRSSSIYASLYDLGGFAGPYLLGAIASGAGYGPMFAVSGALALGAAAYLVSVERLGRRLG